ncbi:hypothetical protein bwei_0341 [Bacillus mycoides]|nr:hypothetical protein bwei_0341 [Bacillus mycoides]
MFEKYVYFNYNKNTQAIVEWTKAKQKTGVCRLLFLSILF